EMAVTRRTGHYRGSLVVIPKRQGYEFKHDLDKNIFVTTKPTELANIKTKYESLSPIQKAELKDVYVSLSGPAMDLVKKTVIMAPWIGQSRKISNLITLRKKAGK
ncbi:MAG: hypothetical protein M1378_11635, partial [Bacteroidetes bacterium]|nr:hypothetical protein [Bacteroidota bacterium]